MSAPYPMPLASQRHTRALVHGLVALQLAQPFVNATQAAELTPVTAGVSLDQAANGVPIVNIATPNAAGISHNQYARFNVGTEGLILNNSAQPVNTRLGGYITGNAQLGAGSARLILNEVTMASPSQLNGYLEVAGQRAGVVVANPWGISCNGCGFINTRQATLATGIPLWNSDGSLQGYRVEDGRLRLDGRGLNAANVDGLALYARVLELNAELYAQDLSVVTGANTIDAATGVATPLAASGTPSAYAIDSSALGGMYADTIRLVGTEAGVGMRLAAPVAALTGALEVRNNGDVRLARTSAQTDLVVNAAGGIALTEQAAAGHDVRLQADDALALADGGLLAGETLTLTAATVSTGVGSEIAARGDLLIAAQVQDYAGTTGSAGTLVLAGGTLSNAQQLAAGTGLSITADTLRNSGSVSTGAGALALTLTGLLDNRSGLLQATDALLITASGLANSGGSLQAGGDLTLQLPAFEHAASAGMLAAGGMLSLLTSGDIVLNGDGLATAGGLRLDAGAAAIRIDSRVEAGADSELRGGYLALGDTALAATQGALTVVADNVDNLGVLYGRDSLTLQVRNVLNNGESGVRRHASLLSGGDLRITNEIGGNLVALNNYGSQIESLSGDLTLRADTLVNHNLGWSTLTYELNPLYSYDPGPTSWYWDSFYGAGISSLSNHMAYRHIATTTMNDVADGGARGSIVAGGNIDIRAGRLTNDRSTISAAGTVEVLADVLENLGTTLTDVTLVRTDRRWHVCNKHSNGNTTCNNYQAYVGTDTVLGETLDYVPAIIEGAAGTVIQADVYNCAPAGAVMPDGGCDTRDPTGTLTAALGPWASLPTAAPGLSVGGIDPSLLPGFNLPGGGLFRLVTTPGHPFLVETDPALNTYQGFLGSAYLLAHLEGWAPDITQKRLGDGYYEIMLVREALLASIGTRFLDPAIADEREQFRYLMDNAVAASAALRLSPGIALSREQIDALQADIVWMEERVIAGQQVLVPVVYLAQGSSRLLQDGAVIGGGSLVIQGDTLMNTGLLTAAGDAALSTERTLANLGGDIRAGGRLTVQAGGDLVNESGRIQGGQVSMRVQGDLIHRTYTATTHQASGSDSYWTTQVGRRAEIAATNSLDIVAGGDVALSAARLTGGSVDILAGGSVLIEAAKLEQGYRFTSADWQAAEEHVRYLQSEVEAMQELRLAAVGNIVATAAWLRGGSVELGAGGDIVLASVTEFDHREQHTQHDGSRSDSSSDVVFDAQRQVGTHIVASGGPAAGLGNVVLAARGGSLTLEASTVAAQGAINVSAEQGINVISGADTESYSLATSREGLTRFRDHQEGYVEQTLAQAGFSAGGDVLLDTRGTINLAAAGLQAGGLLQLGGATLATGADGAALRDADDRLVINRGSVDAINDVAVTLTSRSWNETQTGYTGPMEELINIGSLLAANFNFILTGGQVELPEISTGSRSSTQRESRVAATSTLIGRDILLGAQQSVDLQGTQLIATGLPDASGAPVGGDVNILARDIAFTAAASVTREVSSTSSQTTQSIGASTSTGEFQIGGVQIVDRTRTVDTTSTTHQGVGIQAANIALMADDSAGLVAASLAADTTTGQIVIDARDIHIDGVQDTVVTSTEERVDTKTLTVGVRNAVVDAVLAADALVEGLEAVKAANDALEDAKARVAAGILAKEAVADYERNLAAAIVHAAYLEIAMGAAAATGAATVATGGFYVSGSAQESSTSTTTTQQVGLWRGGSLAASEIRLTALEDLRITGSSLTAAAGTVSASRIEIMAGTNTSSQNSSTTTTHEGMSASSSGAALGSVGVNAGGSHASSQATSTQFVNSRLDIGQLTSESDSLRLAGAVIEADQASITTGKLTITSLQDTYSSTNSSENHSAGIGFGTSGLSSVSGAMGEGSGYARSRITGELSGIIVHDGDTSRIEADHVVLTGGLIANAVRDANGQLVDQGRLNLVTHTLETHDLVDSSESDQRGFNLGLSINLRAGEELQAGTTDAAKASTSASAPPGGNTADKSSRLQPGTLTIGATHTGHRMEGMTFATIGAGDVQVLSDAVSGQDSLAGVNRDVANTQIITLDQDTRGLDASLSVDLRLFTAEGRAQIADEQKNMGRNFQFMGKSVGEGLHEGIETAVLQFDQTEEGRALAAKIESWVGILGIIPTSLNNGGIAFGETPVLLKAKDIDQRQMVAATKEGAFMAAHPELGWLPISETEGFYLLPAERREELKNFMVATVSAELIAGDHSLATYQNATTGMLNTEALALYNAFTQTGTNTRAENAVFTLNYNPTREFFADGLESFVDKVATSNLFGLLDTARPLSFLSTSVAEDTGDYLRSVMVARGDQGANFACHSQGCLLTYSGILSQDGFSTLDKIGEDRTLNFEFNMYGSAVNNVSFHKYLNSEQMVLRSSTVNKHDYVGQSLGENRGTYIYNENDTNRPFEQQVSASQFNIVRDTANKLNLINLGWLFLSSSPHSNYTCTANCGDERK